MFRYLYHSFILFKQSSRLPISLSLISHSINARWRCRWRQLFRTLLFLKYFLDGTYAVGCWNFCKLGGSDEAQFNCKPEQQLHFPLKRKKNLRNITVAQIKKSQTATRNKSSAGKRGKWAMAQPGHCSDVSCRVRDFTHYKGGVKFNSPQRFDIWSAPFLVHQGTTISNIFTHVYKTRLHVCLCMYATCMPVLFKKKSPANIY